MNETQLVLSGSSLIAIFGMYLKMQNQAKDIGAREALVEKRIFDLETDLIKSNKDIDDIKNTLHQIDTRTQVILSKLENKL